MKRYVYALCLLVSLAGVSSCKKGSDPEPDPVVGSWKLDRIRTSGFVAPYTSLNKDNDPASTFGIQDNFTTKSDKTFSGTFRASSIVDYSGNWDFSSNTLTLKDTQGNSDTYTLDVTKTPSQLLGVVVATSDSLLNPTTNKPELVKYNYQFIYSKQ